MGRIDLNKASIAAPCPASWADMEGDDGRSRSVQFPVRNLLLKPMDFVAHKFGVNSLCTCPPVAGMVCLPAPPVPVLPQGEAAEPELAPED